LNLLKPTGPSAEGFGGPGTVGLDATTTRRRSECP
jgi:hypothetical protein